MKKGLRTLGFILLIFVATTLFWLYLLAENAPHQVRVEGRAYPAEVSAFLREGMQSVAAHEAAVEARLVLIGDAGAPPEGNQRLLGTLTEWTREHADRTTTVMLGDNVYPTGFDPADTARGERILGAQLDAIEGPTIVIPGNHDWGGNDARPAHLRAQEEYVNARDDARMLPAGGCPGPETVTLAGSEGAPVAHLVVLDTQWLLRPRERPDCDTSQHAVMNAVTAMRDSLTGAPVFVAAHHPMKTAGPHGGFDRSVGRRLWQTLLGAQGTLGAPLYQAAMLDLHAALRTLRPLAYVTGHEHSLQILEGDTGPRYYFVSGAGAAEKVTPVTSLPETLFAHAHAGFMVIDFFAAGPDEVREIQLAVVEAGRGEVFRMPLEWTPRGGATSETAPEEPPPGPAPE